MPRGRKAGVALRPLRGGRSIRAGHVVDQDGFHGVDLAEVLPGLGRIRARRVRADAAVAASHAPAALEHLQAKRVRDTPRAELQRLREKRTVAADPVSDSVSCRARGRAG